MRAGSASAASVAASLAVLMSSSATACPFLRGKLSAVSTDVIAFQTVLRAHWLSSSLHQGPSNDARDDYGTSAHRERSQARQRAPGGATARRHRACTQSQTRRRSSASNQSQMTMTA